MASTRHCPALNLEVCAHVTHRRIFLSLSDKQLQASEILGHLHRYRARRTLSFRSLFISLEFAFVPETQNQSSERKRPGDEAANDSV
jgi:hypothetical protein